MSRQLLGGELDKVARTLPQKLSPAQQVFGLEGPIRRDPELRKIQLHVPMLRMEGIEVDHRQHGVAVHLSVRLAVAKQEGIVSRVEAQRVVALQGWMLPAGMVNVVISERRLAGSSSARCLSSYFSELRYSSLPAERGRFSPSSNAGPYTP